MSQYRPRSLRENIEDAHRSVRAAQDQAYASNLDGRARAGLRTRLALNRAQSLLIRLLVRAAAGKEL